ncbi:hypothetical protein [Halomicrobium salinisoli]|uniref:hypothetical protein n=1 Tax=Halomicrobium salinisoli TaxID=2878391 RepID=UPI003B8A6F33
MQELESEYDGQVPRDIVVDELSDEYADHQMSECSGAATSWMAVISPNEVFGYRLNPQAARQSPVQ